MPNASKLTLGIEVYVYKEQAMDGLISDCIRADKHFCICEVENLSDSQFKHMLADICEESLSDAGILRKAKEIREYIQKISRRYYREQIERKIEFLDEGQPDENWEADVRQRSRDARSALCL